LQNPRAVETAPAVVVQADAGGVAARALQLFTAVARRADCTRDLFSGRDQAARAVVRKEVKTDAAGARDGGARAGARPDESAQYGETERRGRSARAWNGHGR